MYAGPVERLITEFSKLPGIGPRTAQRLTFHLLGCSRTRCCRWPLPSPR